MVAEIAGQLEKKRYRGFISFSQNERRIAKRLHKALESYRVPKGINAELNKGRRLGRFFIDDHELAASDNLGAALKGALDDAENLIVIASPSAAQSKWVNAEITHFKQRLDSPIFAVIAAGIPNTEDPHVECFPPLLRSSLKPQEQATDTSQEPLAPDLTKEGFSRVFIRLVAGILRIPFDTLWNRERRRRQRKAVVLITISLLSLIAVVVGAALTQRQFDMQNLTARSLDISREGWQNAWRPRFFEPALRAGIAAMPARNSIFESTLTDNYCDLNKPIKSGICALRLSGISLASRLIYGAAPAQEQDNIRNDINDGDTDNFQRRMLMANTHIRDLSFSGNGQRIGMLSSEGKLTVIETNTSAVVMQKDLPGTGNKAVALSDDGRICLASVESGKLVALDVESGDTIAQVDIPSGSVHKIVADKNGWIIFVNGKLLVELSNQFQERWRINTVESGVYNIAPFAPTHRKFVVLESYGYRGLVEVFDLATSSASQIENSKIGEGVGQVKTLAVKPDMSLLALGGNGSGGGDRAGGQVLSLESGDEVARLIGHHGEIYAIAFLPASISVVTGGSDFSIRIWDAHSGDEQLRLIGHVAPIQDIALSPDGRQLVSASWDGTVRLWQIPDYWATDPVRLRDELCERDPFAYSASTILSKDERNATAAFTGRPWNVCEWRGLGSFKGWRQALTVLVVRWLGLNSFDYPAPLD